MKYSNKEDLALKYINKLKNKSPYKITILKGENIYIENQIKQALKALGYKILSYSCGKSGLTVDIEEQVLSGGGLFGEKKVLWVQLNGSLKQWSKKSLLLWDRVKECFDSEQTVIIFKVPADKRFKWQHLSKEIIDYGFINKIEWLKRHLVIQGEKMSNKELDFLTNFNEDLQCLAQWIDLWLLGGDDWAKVALGWGASKGAAPSNPMNGSVAFSWVDSVLIGNKSKSLSCLNLAISSGQDPFMLLALLTKSVRIMAKLEARQKVTGQPGFLINKIQRIVHSSPGSNRGQLLLKKLAFIDYRIKSSPLDPKLALQSI